MSPIATDSRPRTAVLHHYGGIGDIVFHLPYVRAIARTSLEGRVTLIARPTCQAPDLLAHESSIDGFIEYDRWPTRQPRRGRHNGLIGAIRFARELRAHGFARIVIFSDRVRYGFQAWLAAIPQRIGYGGFGWNWPQRLFLTAPPYIDRYQGPCVANYQLATALMLAHGFVSEPLVPRFAAPEHLARQWQQRLSPLGAPRVALIVGAALPKKDWGWRNFGQLAEDLLRRGYAVVCVGGPAEQSRLEQVRAAVAPELQARLSARVPPSLPDCAAILAGCVAAVGNDTGVSQIAAACGVPTVVLLGPRPLLCHDPDLVSIRAPALREIAPHQVLECLERSIEHRRGGARQAPATPQGAT